MSRGSREAYGLKGFTRRCRRPFGPVVDSIVLKEVILRAWSLGSRESWPLGRSVLSMSGLAPREAPLVLKKGCFACAGDALETLLASTVLCVGNAEERVKECPLGFFTGSLPVLRCYGYAVLFRAFSYR